MHLVYTTEKGLDSGYNYYFQCHKKMPQSTELSSSVVMLKLKL